MEYTYAFTDRLTILTCCVCAVHYGMPEQLHSQRRTDGQSFYCPNGHGQSYTDTDEKRLAREKAALERALVETKTRLQLEQNHHQHTAHQLRATKGSLTKTKKRIVGGACPCCNRTFGDLARHMAGQHPEYAKAG